MTEQLSMLDTMFLELEQFDENAHMHIGAGLVFEPLPGGGTPSVDDLRELIAARMGVMPRFAQVLSAPHAGPLTWLTWEPARDFDVTAHVHHAALPAPGGPAELREWLADFFSHRLDRHRPLWELVLLEGLEDGRWALASKTHHCLVDGVGSMDIGNLLLDETPDAPLMPPAPLAPRPPEGGGRFWLSPGLVLHGARAAAGASMHPREAFDRLRSAAELVFREEVIGAPHTSFNVPLTGLRDFPCISFDLADLQAVKVQRGGTVNDVVLAMCTGALRQLLLERGEPLPAAGLRAQVPVNIRTEDRAHALGNQLTSLFVELPVATADPIARYDQIVSRAAALKHGSQQTGGKAILDATDMGPPLAGALLARTMFGGPRMFNLTITNVPGPPRRLYALGAPLAEIQPLVPLFAGHAIGIAVISYAGRMTFGINADAVAMPDVDVLIDGLHDSYEQLRPRRSRRPAHRPAVTRA